MPGLVGLLMDRSLPLSPSPSDTDRRPFKWENVRCKDGRQSTFYIQAPAGALMIYDYVRTNNDNRVLRE